MSIQIIGWIAFALSLTGVILNSKHVIWCWPAWILSNILFLIHYINIGDLPGIAQWSTFMLANIYGWHSWLNEGYTKQDHDNINDNA